MNVSKYFKFFIGFICGALLFSSAFREIRASLINTTTNVIKSKEVHNMIRKTAANVSDEVVKNLKFEEYSDSKEISRINPQ